MLADGDHLIATGAPIRLVRAGAVAFDLNTHPATATVVATRQQRSCLVCHLSHPSVSSPVSGGLPNNHECNIYPLGVSIYQVAVDIVAGLALAS